MKDRWVRGPGTLLASGLLLGWACGGGGDNPTVPPFRVWGAVVARDLNGDGRPDVAVATTRVDGSRHENQVLVQFGLPGGAFDTPRLLPVGSDPWGLTGADLDGDGRQDLAASLPDTVEPQLNTIGDSGALSLLRQDPAGSGAFLQERQVWTGGAAQAVTSLSLDGAPLPALAVADGVHVNSRALLLRPDPARPGAFLAPEPLPAGTGSGFLGLVAADLDGNGLADLVLAGGPGLAVFYQLPGGSFQSPVHLAVGVNTQAVAAADLDGDGRMDLAAVCAGDPYDPRSGGGRVVVFRQGPLGTFSATALSVADGARQIGIADLDGDGLPDLAVLSLVYQAFTTPSKLTVLRQTAAAQGVFRATQVQDGTLNATFFALADLDGDGRTDVLLNEGPSLMIQTATPGVFAAPRPLR